jgi:hypothetical protein
MKRGTGEVTATMPPGAVPMTRAMNPDLIAKVDPLPPLPGPFNSHLDIGHVPIAGHIVYSLDPDWITVASGTAATEKTYVEFTGRTAWGQRSNMPFHVTSADWRRRPRAGRHHDGVRRADGRIAIGGRGSSTASCSGVLAAREGISPAIACAWDTVWGHASPSRHQNSYVDISRSVIGRTDRRSARGRFSARLPAQGRRRGLNANVTMSASAGGSAQRVRALRLSVGGLTSGDFHVYGNYRVPAVSAS